MHHMKTGKRNEPAQRIQWLAASVDNAPLNLQALELQHAFLETTTLLDVMREHYQKECLRQAQLLKSLLSVVLCSKSSGALTYANFCQGSLADRRNDSVPCTRLLCRVGG